MGLNKRLIDQAGVAAGVTNTDNFAPVTYTGNGSAQSITSLDFQPDLVWIKCRSNATSHELHDSVRGEPSRISSDLTSAESTTYNGFVSLESNGFNLDGAGSGGEVNTSSRTYVAWCFKGGGTAVSNTSGSITSQVSANADAGFSIVSYTGNATGSTIGHGLSQAPELIIAKSRSVAQNWVVYHKDAGNQYWLQLNGTTAKLDEAIWADTTPTDSVFSINNNVVINTSGSTNIAYCFHSVDGYQKIGSYTGGSSSLINIGFRPRWIMIKATSTTSRWAIYDTVREPSGTIDQFLEANSNAAEAAAGTSNYKIIFDDNGFKFDHTYGQLNGSGNTYIYLAIA